MRDPDALAKMIKDEIARWKKVIEFRNLQDLIVRSLPVRSSVEDCRKHDPRECYMDNAAMTGQLLGWYAIPAREGSGNPNHSGNPRGWVGPGGTSGDRTPALCVQRRRPSQRWRFRPRFRARPSARKIPLRGKALRPGNEEASGHLQVGDGGRHRVCVPKTSSA